MRATPIWKREIGRPTSFKTPDDLWKAACDYFQWCDDNPLYESKAFCNKDGISYAAVPKVRAYTLGGFCIHARIGHAYFRQFNEETHPEFSAVIEEIKNVIYNQKFTAAAADLLNANIISRDLGLADRKSIENKYPENIVIERVIKDDANKP